MATVYYQNTVDGRCAAAIAKQVLRHCFAVSTNFNTTPDLRKVRIGDDLYLLGVCFDMSAMWELNKGHMFTYIDHHVSAANKCAQYHFNARYGVIDTSESTGVLTWKFFHKDEPVPRTVRMISDYTLGNFGDLETMEFMAGLNTVSTWPDQTILWDNLFRDDPEAISRIRERGRELNEYNRLEDTKYASELIYPIQFNNWNCLAVNYRPSSSRFFTPYLDAMKDKLKDIDVLITYTWAGFNGQYKFSFYANKPEIDLLPFLESYRGGGGQPNVGGFSNDEIPWKEVAGERFKAEPFDCKKFLDEHITARQYKQMSNRSLYNQCSYYAVINECNCAIINTPIEDKDIFDNIRSDLPKIDFGITWVWSNRGQYKITIHPLLGNLTQEGLIKFVSKMGYEGGAKLIGSGVSFYVDYLPFPVIKRDESILLTSIKE